MKRRGRTDEEIAEILRRYPHEPTGEIATSMKLSKSMVYNVAFKNNVEKIKHDRCVKCERKHYCRGLCSRHYQQVYKGSTRKGRHELTLEMMSQHHYEKGGRRAVQKTPPGWGYAGDSA